MTTNLHGLVVDLYLVVLELSSGVYGASSSVVCILSKYDNDIPMIRWYFCRRVDNLESSHLMIIDAGDVNLTVQVL